ncbi:MAG: glycosyltransferase family 4 protein [Nitrospira sp.]|nr:glycosyltransferase family 4 protein [Nitrospira sp.]
MRPTILRLPGPVSSELAPTLRRIHAVCANGDALRHIRAFLGDHATELPIGLDSNLFQPGPSQERHRLGWSGTEWVIGYVGRLAYIKGVDLLADAFKQLRACIPQARLLMIGAGEEQGKLREALKEELASGLACIEADVPHERLADWYRAMNVFVMPSRYENYSNAVLEALACGVPFLGSNAGGNPGLVESHGGCLFEVGSVDALSQALRSMADAFRRSEGQETVRSTKPHQVVGWDTTAARLEKIIQVNLNIQPDLSSI